MGPVQSKIYRLRVHRDGRFWFTKYFSTKEDAEEYMDQNEKFGDEYPCGVLEVLIYTDPKDMAYALESAALKETAILVRKMNVQWRKPKKE
tara:strand:- start:615 stop:887 length:273 start_codon:yes stop_codon:yes gene_type:complete